MFVVVDPMKYKVYGSFVTLDEAVLWARKNTHTTLRGAAWFAQSVEQMGSDCAMINVSHTENGDGDCC
jgi:hypothetical protein